MGSLLVCLLLVFQSDVGLRVQVLQGEGRDIVPGQTAPVPMSIRVTDRNNRPVNGATVTFSAPEKGAGGDFDGERTFRALTNEDGVAGTRSFRPNRIEGRYPILVQVEYLGEVASAIILESNTVPKRSRGKLFAIAAAAGAGAVGAALAARGSGGGGTSSPSAPSTPPPSSGSAIPTITFGGSTINGPR